MLERFDNREEDYLRWVHAHRDGFVVNLTRRGIRPEYPMVHLASHGLISTPSLGSFTTGEYIKVCSLDLAELEKWCRGEMGRELRQCGVCFK